VTEFLLLLFFSTTFVFFHGLTDARFSTVNSEEPLLGLLQSVFYELNTLRLYNQQLSSS